MSNFDRPYTFDRVVQVVISTVVVVVLLLFINRIKGVLLPFLLAWLLAYLVNPLVEFCQRKFRVNRAVAILITLGSIATLIGGAIYFISPYLVAEFSRFVHILDIFRNESGKVQFVPQSWIEWINNTIDLAYFTERLKGEDLLSIIDRTIPGIKRIMSGSISLLIGIFLSFIVFLYLIFILIDYDRIVKGFSGLIPLKYRNRTMMVVNDVKNSMNRYLRGQSLVALCVGILFATGFKIIGLPLGIAFGLFMGVLNLVPYLQIAGYIPALLLCLLKAAETDQNFWLIALSAAIVLIVVQIIQDSFLVPKIMGKVTGLNPAIILLSLSIWGSLMGIAGMIIALPMTSLLLSYYQRFIVNSERLTEENSARRNTRKE